MQYIWPGTEIEVLGVTGDYDSGKTVFALTIDPANTLLYDFEKSAGTYTALGFDRRDYPEILQRKYPKGYSQKQAFQTWREDVLAVEPGKYSVIACDPISDLEAGLVEYVKSLHKNYNFKTEESFLATGGIFWEQVKSTWKQILADLSSRCQTFCFTTHLRKVWKYGKPTTESIPKGKSTLLELASLYLYMEREPDPLTKKIPLVPSAVVLKSRLATTTVTDDGIRVQPLLPPRIPVATPAAIRNYIASPPDHSSLREDEQLKERQLGESERLELEAKIAEDRRAAEEAALALSLAKERQEEARSSRMAQVEKEEPKKEATATEGNGTGGLESLSCTATEAEELILKAESSGLLDRFKAGVWNRVKDRNREWALKGLKHSVQLLKKEEFREFDSYLEKVKSGG